MRLPSGQMCYTLISHLILLRVENYMLSGCRLWSICLLYLPKFIYLFVIWLYIFSKPRDSYITISQSSFSAILAYSRSLHILQLQQNRLTTSASKHKYEPEDVEKGIIKLQHKIHCKFTWGIGENCCRKQHLFFKCLRNFLPLIFYSTNVPCSYSYIPNEEYSFLLHILGFSKNR